ncbi:MAG: lipid II flippase MurJ, partial [Eubacteriales bacterium]|nr:lipid II flippase MurJ [Eubacteriales bacterium]
MNIGEKNPCQKGKTHGINLIFAGMAAAAFIAKLFGFLREIVIGANLGTTETADVYTQIFGIPALVFAAVGVAMSSLCIPVLTGFYSTEDTSAGRDPGRFDSVRNTALESYENGKSPEAGKRFVSGLLQNVFIVTAAASFIFALLAYPASRLLLPGLQPGTDIFDTAVLLIKVMAPSLIFVCLTYISSGILQIHGRFIYTALISLPFNIAIIIVLLSKGADIKLLGIVTTAGWAMQFLVQLPALYRERYRIVPAIRFGFGDPAIRNIYRQLPPIII